MYVIRMPMQILELFLLLNVIRCTSVQEQSAASVNFVLTFYIIT